MSIVISINARQNGVEALSLIKSAVEAEIARFELAVKMTNKRLLLFEKKYNVTSDHFMSHWAAEDLEGGDDEYVAWSGEYRLKQRLEQKLARLMEVEYVPADILQPY